MGFLHQTGSSNPLGVRRDSGRVPFHPYYVVKDLVGVMVMILRLGIVVLLSPDLFLEPENYIPANPLVTPTHIKPEWYFLWLYAILRAVPNKLGGVVAMFSGILGFVVLPFLVNSTGGCAQARAGQVIFWVLVRDFFLLTWLGSRPAEEPYNLAAQLCSALFFRFFIYFPVWREMRSR